MDKKKIKKTYKMTKTPTTKNNTKQQKNPKKENYKNIIIMSWNKGNYNAINRICEIADMLDKQILPDGRIRLAN